MKVVIFLFVVCCFLSASTVHAESSRAEELRKIREAKKEKLEPPQKSGAERAMEFIEKGGLKEATDFNIASFYPSFSSLSTGSGLAPGLRYWGPEIGGSPIDLQLFGAYSLKGYQLYEMQIGKVEPKSSEFFLTANNWGGFGSAPRIPTFRPNYYLYGDFRYRHFPQEDFFGVGPRTSEFRRTDYQIQESLFDLVAGYQFNPHIGVGGRFGLLRPDISGGTDNRFPDIDDEFSEASAPGLTQQPDFLRMNTSLFLDYRDRSGNPHSGGILGVSFSRYEDRDFDSYSFQRIAFDARHYLPLGSPTRVVALRFFTSLDDPANNDRVPFYFMETLGGSETLRGFREFRFRDENLLYLSGEYRWEAWPALEFALFYDAGKVFRNRSNYDFNNLEDSWGFGIRLKTRSSVFLRIESAKSDEGRRFYFRFGSSF